MRNQLLLLMFTLLLSACTGGDELQSTSLIHAAEMGDMRGVRHYAEPNNINVADDHGRTPMAIAILRGDQGVVSLLFELGATLPEDEPCFAIYYMLEWQDSEMLKVLLTHGLDPDHDYQRPDGAKTTLMVQAAASNLSGIINILAAEGADIEKEGGGWTPLEAAVANRGERAVRELLKLGARPTEDAKDLARQVQSASILKLLEQAE